MCQELMKDKLQEQDGGKSPSPELNPGVQGVNEDPLSLLQDRSSKGARISTACPT